MKRITLPLFLLIFLAGLLLRTVNISNSPAGFTPDEAAFGYNAYSLILTGHDEWGEPFYKLPVVGLRSFGDYKLPLYSFFTVPVITMLGLSEFSVRLSNALISSLSILAFGIFVYRLTKNRLLLLISSAFLAFSPWSVPLSRGAFEANLTVSLLIIGLSLAVTRRYFVSVLIFVLTMYSYHTGRLLAPFVFAISFYMYFPKKKLANIKYVGLFLLLALPALYSLVAFNARSADISIFNPADGWAEMANKRLKLINSGWPEPMARLVSNKLIFAGRVFVSNYLSYFSPRFLFTSGSGESSYGMLPGHGVVNILELFFLPLGLWYFFRRRTSGLWLVILGLLLLSPIPASLAKGSGFAANRAAPLIIPFALLSSGGVEFIRRRANSRLLLAVLGIVFVALSVNTYLSYRTDLPLASARSMGYGFKQAVPAIITAGNYYSEVRVSRALSEPHIYMVFYSLWPPSDYQSSSVNWAEFQDLGFRFLDQYDGYWLGNFRFGDLNFERPVNFPVLYIGRLQDFPEGTKAEILSTFPDGQPAIVAVIKTGLDNLSFQL